MADKHSREIRSYNMRMIKAKDTTPELTVRRFLFANALRYRIHDKKLPGKPDIVFKKYKTVLFINGCFWHGHKDCKYYVIPKTRTEWWLNKLNGNVLRDKNNYEQLKKDGWKIIVVWECELKNKLKDKTLNRLLKYFKK